MFIGAEDAATIPALQSAKLPALGIPHRLEAGHETPSSSPSNDNIDWTI
jgi:hypothetical protein